MIIFYVLPDSGKKAEQILELCPIIHDDSESSTTRLNQELINNSYVNFCLRRSKPQAYKPLLIFIIISKVQKV